jgi:Protein of unknown function (DUF2798)
MRDNQTAGQPAHDPRNPSGAVFLQVKAQFIKPVIVAAIMAFFMTAIITFINLGLRPDFLRRWMIAYAVAWPFATLAAFVAVPVAERVTAWIVKMLDGGR